MNLITGSANGLGKYLLETLGGIGFDRGDSLPEKTGVIIHCAFNSARSYNGEDAENLILEDLLLVRNLTKIPHSYFIFISSIDVLHATGAYAFAKKKAEELVKEYATKYLIVRLSALLGKYSRQNSLLKIMEGDQKLSLTANSIFNYILYEDVADFIKFVIENKLQGIYNLASSKNITLKEAEEIIKDYLGEVNIIYGDYYYSCGNINISEALKTGAFPEKTSAQVVNEFIKL